MPPSDIVRVGIPSGRPPLPTGGAQFADVDSFIEWVPLDLTSAVGERLSELDGVVASTSGSVATLRSDPMSLLPCEEESRLAVPRRLENFLERVFAYRRLRRLLTRHVGAGNLVRFHTRHKLLLLAHVPGAYTALGRVVAVSRAELSSDVVRGYGRIFMQALAVMPTRGRHVNVLQHMAGYFRRLVDDETRRAVAQAIADYAHGRQPLAMPVQTIADLAVRHDVRYLLNQVYLEPYPNARVVRPGPA